MASEICFPLEMHLVLNFKTLLRFFWCPGHSKSTPGSPSSESPQGRAQGMVQHPCRWRPQFLCHGTTPPFAARQIMRWNCFVLAHSQNVEKSCRTKQVSYL